MRKLFSCLFILPLAFSCSVAQSPSKYANGITEESSKNHLTILASREYEGRGTGQKGGQMTVEYIANEFKKYGLKPSGLNGTYFQALPLKKVGFTVSQFDLGGKSFTYGKDFYVQGFNKNESFNTDEIVFVGYGIQDDKYNELKGTSIEGKVVLVVNDGEPQNADGNYLITGTKNKSDWSGRFKRLQELQKLKPKMILATGSQVGQMIERFSSQLTGGRITLDKGENQTPANAQQAIPVINVTEDIANYILAKSNTSVAKFKELANAKVQPVGAPIQMNLKAEMGTKSEDLSDPNVIGLVEGTDKKDEIVVIGGHWDHDGILPNGTFFPGADDNGSGTVAVIELAKAFAQAKADGKGPRRSILFIAFAAEEKGLFGSQHYADNPIHPLSNTVACVNIDMIGRIDDMHLNGDHNYIHVIGVNKLSTDLRPIVESANKTVNLNLDYGYDDPKEPMRLYYRSDHYNFAKKGIPSLFFFSGLHPHYHTPEDTVDKIDFPMMVKRQKLIFNVVWEIANRDNRPVVDLSLEEARGTGR